MDMAQIIASVEDAIEIAEKEAYRTIANGLREALALLKEQEAKTGKWIEQDGFDGDVYYDCSVCGESWVMIDGTPQENRMNFCPHCGAKMEGR